MRSLLCGLPVFVILAAADCTRATNVVEPDAFPVDTELHAAFFPDVILWRVNGFDGRLDTGVYSRDSAQFDASTGDLLFGHMEFTGGFPPYQLFWNSGTTQGSWQLRANFLSPANYVAIDVLDLGSGSRATMNAFDASGTLIASMTTEPITGSFIPVVASVSRRTADIAYVMVGGTGDNTVLLDYLRYTVPEPAMLSLIVTACSLWFLCTRRRDSPTRFRNDEKKSRNDKSMLFD
jgi:hypothetical protein